jgi:integrase
MVVWFSSYNATGPMASGFTQLGSWFKNGANDYMAIAYGAYNPSAGYGEFHRRLVNHSAAAEATPPRTDKKDIATLDERGMERLIAMTASDRFGIPLLLAIAGGLCRGEAVGVRWADLKFDTATLAVRQSIEQTPKVCGSKSPRAKAPVPSSYHS